MNAGSDNVGLTGLEAMGKPIAEQSANKFPGKAQLDVYDIVEDSVPGMVARFPEKEVVAYLPTNIAKVSASCSIYIESIPIDFGWLIHLQRTVYH